MQLGSQDHYDAIAMFDRIAAKSPFMRFRLDKEPKASWRQGFVYQDGHANMAFNAFLEGAVYGKAIAA